MGVGSRVGPQHEEDLVGGDVRQAERPARNDPVGLERLDAPHEVEEQVVVRLRPPDFLYAAFRSGTEGEDGERALLRQLEDEVVHDRGHGRETRVPVVETAPLLLPLPAQGDELAGDAFGHGP